MNLTPEDRKAITYLAGQALNGILADHEHHAQFGGLDCANSSSEWACRYGFETWMRLRQKFQDAEKVKVTFPKHVRAYKR